MIGVPKPKRRKKAKRKANLAPRKPIAKRNAKRNRAEHKRAYGTEARIHFVKWSKCQVCFAPPPSENAHTHTGGMGRKADASTICALCSRCHRELHQVGRVTFEGRHNVRIEALAAHLHQAWLTHQSYFPSGATRV